GQIQTETGMSADGQDSYEITHDYDPVSGEEIKVTEIWNGDRSTQDAEAYTYTLDGQIQTIRYTHEGKAVATLSMAYDAYSRLIRETDALGYTTLYFYNDAGQLDHICLEDQNAKGKCQENARVSYAYITPAEVKEDAGLLAYIGQVKAI